MEILKKTFLKNIYVKYTNLGLQKFRIDYTASRAITRSSISSRSLS